MTDRKKTFDLMDRYILTDRNLDRIAEGKRRLAEMRKEESDDVREA